jgi:hypothetical protein
VAYSSFWLSDNDYGTHHWNQRKGLSGMERDVSMIGIVLNIVGLVLTTINFFIFFFLAVVEELP